MLSAEVKPFSHSVPPHSYFDPHNYSRWNEFKEPQSGAAQVLSKEAITVTELETATSDRQS